MNIFAFSWRQTLRGWRSGELRVLTAALVIAVAAVTAVGFFTERVHDAVRQQAGESLAADLVLAADKPIPQQYAAEARAAHLRLARVLTFASVILADNAHRLADIHAVSRAYPLRGRLRVAQQAFGAARPIGHIPRPGTVWLKGRLLAALGIQVGDTVQIGKARFKVAHVLAYAPGQAWSFVDFAPMVLLNRADLAATGLVTRNSRVHYHLLMAGSARQVAAVRARFAHRLAPGMSLKNPHDARPGLRIAIERAQKFLGLAAMVSVLIAAVAVAMASRHYARQHTETIAILRCLGTTRRRARGILLLVLLWVGLAAGLAGALLGFLAQLGLTYLFASALPANLPMPSAAPVGLAVAVALLILTGFALPALLRLGATPPARVLRRDLDSPRPSLWLVYGLPIAATIALVYSQVQNAKLLLYLCGGLAGTVLALVAAAALMLQCLRPLRGRVGVAWRYGLANLLRRRSDSIAQMVAFGLGLMVLLLLGVVRTNLLAGWQASLPADAPNQFVINIQPNQRHVMARFFRQHGLSAPRFYPLVRARLTAIDGRPVDQIQFKSRRARHIIRHEANLTWARHPQVGNRIVAGRWWNGATAHKPLISMEKKRAALLGVGVGDTLTYAVAGERITARIASLRNIRWDTFRPNFFVVMSPGALASQPADYITSFYLPTARAPMLTALVRKLPNLTVFDVDRIMQTVRQMMNQASLAVEYVFGFTLIAGVMVLVAAVQASADTRRFESALLRALGARRGTVLQGVLAEFTLLGFAAGLLAAFAASGVGWLLARQVFNLSYHVDPWLWLAGAGAGTLLVALSGLLTTRRVINQPPLVTLRRQ
jgi:putative ABC transport system permease protein